jgi:hypothetical protein
MHNIFKSLAFGALFPVMALQAATISGTVTASRTGDPIESVKLVITGQKGPADTAVTDKKGAYAFTGVATGIYLVTATKAGYQEGYQTVNAVQQNGNYTSNIVMTVTGGGGREGAVAGTVKDDSSKQGIANATVILSHRTGLRGDLVALDTVKTGADGKYLFDKVAPLANYTLAVTADKYQPASNSDVDVVAGDTIVKDFSLKRVPTPSSVVMGKVTDAASKGPISGAKVVLRRRVVVNAQVTLKEVDWILTGTDGSYKLVNLAASTQLEPYSLLVTKEGYNQAVSGNIEVGQGETETVDVALTKIAKGSLTVFVGLDSTGNPALAGANVIANLEGAGIQQYSGTTNPKGWLTLPEVVVGTYSVSVSLKGYVSKVASRSVSANEKDSGNVYLARATDRNSKMLSGLVRDVDGNPVITFEAAGSSNLILTASAKATGDYVLDPMSTTITGGMVTVELAGYTTYTTQILLSGAITNLNVTLKKPFTGLRVATVGRGISLVLNGATAYLELPAAAQAGMVRIVDAKGVIAYAARIPAGSTRAYLPTRNHGRSRSFLILDQGGSMEKMILPAGF